MDLYVCILASEESDNGLRLVLTSHSYHRGQIITCAKRGSYSAYSIEKVEVGKVLLPPNTARHPNSVNSSHLLDFLKREETKREPPGFVEGYFTGYNPARNMIMSIENINMAKAEE